MDALWRRVPSCSSACMTKTATTLHVIPCGIIAPETSGWFKNEINGLEDLEGLEHAFLSASVLK